MANLTNNRINTTATAAQVTAVKTALQTIAANLPFLVGLTPFWCSFATSTT